MAVIRTENASVSWLPESVWGGGASGTWYRFGHFEILNAPDPEYEWYPYYGVFAGRSRSNIFRGRQTLRGSIPDIRMQGFNTLFLTNMFGRSSAGYYLEGKSATDETIPSFAMIVGLRDTDGTWQPIRVYVGGLVNRWTMSANEGEELHYSLDEMLFKDLQHNMAGIGKYNAGIGAWGVQGEGAGGRFTFAECQFQMFGLTFSRIRRFSLTCDQQIEMRYYLQRGGSSDYQQVPNGYVPGKRSYRMEVDLDMADPTIDRDVYEWLLSQGATSWPGYTVGTQIVAAFTQVGSGEGTNQLVLTAGSTPSSIAPSSVIVSAPYNIPAPPAGVPTVTVAFDVDSAQVYVA